MGYRYNAITGQLDVVDTTTVPTIYVSQIDTDSGSAIPVAHIINLIGGNSITTSGTGNTVTVKNLADITKYVVDVAVGETAYQTIQSALDAANTAGGPAAVYVRPGTYTENLTHYDGIDLWGAVGVADTQTCKIIGTHTPPASGTLTIRNIFLQSATDIFTSAVAGTADLILIDCAVNVTNGYTFNLPNWTGSFTGFDIGEIGSTNDGWINNTAGAFAFMVNITAGKGSGNTCTISGSSEFYNVHVQCPITFQSTGTAVISGGCWFDNTLSTADTATVSIFNSLCDTGANQAITHNSASTLILSTTSIDSSNSPAIGGTGTIEATGVDFDDDSTFAGTLTLNGGKSISGSARLLDRTADTIAYYSTGGELSELGPLTDGQIIIGSTGGTPVAAAPTNGSNISWTLGAGTLEADLTGTTNHAIQLGNATGSLTSLGVLTNGQLPIGSTGADPVAASLTAPAAGITITGGAGTITFALADDLAGIEALATTGIVSRTAADTYAATSITQHAVLIGDASEVPANLGPLTNGQLVIGSTGNAPVAAAPTNGNNISWTTGAGTLQADVTGTTQYAVQVGDATGSLDSLALGTSGQVLTSNGAGANPSWQDASVETYEEVTDAAKAMAVNYVYGANRAGGVTFTLPATAAVGTILEIVGIQGLWSLAQNAGQTVYFGNTNTTAGAGGSLTATNAGDCIRLRCIVADTDWRISSSIGNLTVV